MTIDHQRCGGDLRVQAPVFGERFVQPRDLSDIKVEADNFDHALGERVGERFGLDLRAFGVERQEIADNQGGDEQKKTCVNHLQDRPALPSKPAAKAADEKREAKRQAGDNGNERQEPCLNLFRDLGMGHGDHDAADDLALVLKRQYDLEVGLIAPDLDVVVGVSTQTRTTGGDEADFGIAAAEDRSHIAIDDRNGVHRRIRREQAFGPGAKADILIERQIAFEKPFNRVHQDLGLRCQLADIKLFVAAIRLAEPDIDQQKE
ncbi:MAG: hypothetical protein OEU92_09525 [Alphaproteobacteria bacterium]|nr:hypothetical protein [Alphaproteobacteria bacterium]